MIDLSTPTLTSQGHKIDTSPGAFGLLTDSSALLDSPELLQQRMKKEGYLYLKGLLNQTEVIDARMELLKRLDATGRVDKNHPLIEGHASPEVVESPFPDLTKDNAPLKRVLYSGAMMETMTKLLGESVRHYDYTWFRCIAPKGHGIYPHSDVVYMGRGTHNLFTAWTPMGDIPLNVGGLMILENSPMFIDKLQPYLKRDVDQYCTNYADADDIRTGKKLWHWSGQLSKNLESLREKFNSRWLSADFKMGDVLIFSVYTIHSSLDNQSNVYRLSSDTRYQLASDPIDERWIGENPPAHGVAAKRGLAC